MSQNNEATRSEEIAKVGSQSTHLSHPEGLCDNQNCRECWLLPCTRCNGIGSLKQLNPVGFDWIVCHKCGGCGAQL